MDFDNLFGGPAPTLLPTDPAAAELAGGAEPGELARRYPASSLAWAVLAEAALSAAPDSQAGPTDARTDQDLVAYAYARVGYHRGLDALRRSGWKGFGPVPWEHEPNQGFLRCLVALAGAADRIGDTEEAVRCRDLLTECDPTLS